MKCAMSPRGAELLDGCAKAVYECRRAYQLAVARVHADEAGIDEIGRRQLAAQAAESALLTALLLYFGACEERFGFGVGGSPLPGRSGP